MTRPFIEHVNLTVRDPAKSAQLFVDMFDWRIRWAGPSQKSGHTVHVGDDQFYLALCTMHGDQTPDDVFVKGRPLNHVAIVVDDLDEIEARAIAAGVDPFNHGDYAPGRRFYIFDFDGNEYEIVSYAKRKTTHQKCPTARANGGSSRSTGCVCG